MHNRQLNILNNQMGYISGETPFSPAEIARRQEAVRAALRAADCQVLIAQLCYPTASMALDPYITWLTGTPGYKSTLTLLLPADGELVLVPGSGQQGTAGAVCPYLGSDTSAMDALLAGAKRIAYCQTGRMQHLFYLYLRETAPQAEIVEFSDQLERIKAVKSPEELEALRQAAWIQDMLITGAAAYLRPGRSCTDIYSDIMKMLADLGGDLSLMSKLLIASGKNGVVDGFPTISPATREHLCFPEYRLQEDDWVHIIYETPGYGGYYGETGRIFYFQEPCAQARDIWKKAVDTLEYQASRLRPGVTLHTIREETNAYLASIGSQPDNNIFQIRGIGNMTVDRPQLYGWDHMELASGMALSLQPRFRNEHGTAIALDTYVVPAEGEAYRFSRLPQELIIL